MGLGEKKQIVVRYISQGLASKKALKIAGISRHQYYHKPKAGRRGRKPSTHTPRYVDGHWGLVENQLVIQAIKQIKMDPDLDAGYQNLSHALRQKGFWINPKKTYRLMKQHHLLKEKHQRPAPQRVKYRKVLPKGPLEVLEMDIKMVWIEQDKKHAFILNILDTFTRKWLYYWAGFSITQNQVKRAWQHIIVHFLQPYDCLERGIHVEVRNDNDKRFSAKMVQGFFKENKLNQVFTHPYTPQENGHVESFHAILNEHLKRQIFWNLKHLDQDLVLFMEKYNNQRIHGSIAYLCPNDFQALYELGLIETRIDEKKREIRFKRKIDPWLVKLYTGNDEPEGSLLPGFEPLDGAIKTSDKEMIGANISNNTRSKESPSVVSCTTNLLTDFCTITEQN